MRRYLVQLPQRLSANRAGVFPPGAIVVGNQTTVSPYVRPGHGLEPGHKFYLKDPDGGVYLGRIFTVKAVAPDRIMTTLPKRFTWTDGDVLIPLGNDSMAGMCAGTLLRPALDGTASLMDLPATKTLHFYGDGAVVWIVLFDSKNEPVDVLIDVHPMIQAGGFHA